MGRNNVFAVAYKYHALARCVIASGGRRNGKSALVTMRYLKTLNANESSRYSEPLNINGEKNGRNYPKTVLILYHVK